MDFNNIYTDNFNNENLNNYYNVPIEIEDRIHFFENMDDTKTESMSNESGSDDEGLTKKYSDCFGVDEYNDNSSENEDTKYYNKEYENNLKAENDLNESPKMTEIFKNEEYFEKLFLVFMKYYNEKYNKNETIFTGIDDEKKTNIQMEFMFKAINDFNNMKELLNVDSMELMEYIYKKGEYIENMKYEELYCLDMKNLRLYTPLLINALNYVIVNNIEEWYIFSLKEY